MKYEAFYGSQGNFELYLDGHILESELTANHHTEIITDYVGEHHLKYIGDVETGTVYEVKAPDQPNKILHQY